MVNLIILSYFSKGNQRSLGFADFFYGNINKIK
jgi:hypothetical protein